VSKYELCTLHAHKPINYNLLSMNYRHYLLNTEPNRFKKNNLFIKCVEMACEHHISQLLQIKMTHRFSACIFLSGRGRRVLTLLRDTSTEDRKLSSATQPANHLLIQTGLFRQFTFYVEVGFQSCCFIIKFSVVNYCIFVLFF